MEQLRSDLLHGNGTFSFIWMSGNGGLNEKIKRQRLRDAILKINITQKCDQLKEYFPSTENEVSSLDFPKFGILIYGLVIILSYKVDIWLRQALRVVKLNNDRRLTSNVSIDIFDDPLLPSGQIEKEVNFVELYTLGMDMAEGNFGHLGDVDSQFLELEESAASESFSGENSKDQTRNNRRKRRRTKSQLPGLRESQIIDLLKQKIYSTDPRANTITEPNLAEQPPVDDNGFGRETVILNMEDPPFEVNQIIPDIERLDLLKKTNGEECSDARQISPRTPDRRIPPNNNSKRPLVPDENDTLNLEPLPVRRNSKRICLRRLTFKDKANKFPMEEIQKRVKSMPSYDKLQNMANQYHAVLPATTKLMRRGWEVVDNAGRIPQSDVLRKMLTEINLSRKDKVIEQLKKKTDYIDPDEIRFRTEIPSFDMPSSILHAPARPSPNQQNVLSSRSELEVTESGIDGNLAVDSLLSVLQHHNTHNQNETAMEISLMLSPRVLPISNEVIPDAPLRPTEQVQEKVTFSEIVPFSKTRKEAAMTFAILLKQQQLKKLELIQHEAYGPIEIKLLHPRLNLSNLD